MDAPVPVSIQNDFSLTDRSFELELAEACAPRHLDIGFLAYGALCGGFLSGKYLDAIPPRSRHTTWPNFQPRYHSEPVRWATREYAKIADRHGLSLTQMALAWVMHREYVTSTIIGATTTEQLAECIDAWEVEIPPPALEEIEQQHMRCPNPNKAARAISPGFVKDVRAGV